MRDSRRPDHRRNQLPGGVSPGPHPIARSLFGVLAVVATMIALGVAAAPGLGYTGSVYYDSGSNVGAGVTQFNGTLTGVNNVGLGYNVLPSLTTGNGDIAVGNGALNNVTSGLRNVSIDGLYYTTTGNDNVASGFDALNSNVGGNANIASGSFALNSNTSGDNNIATGYQALSHATGSRNVALGANAGANLTNGSDNIDIANQGVAGESGVIRIGTVGKQNAAFLAGVYGKTVGGTTKAVVVNGAGRLGTAPAPAAPALKGESKTLDRLRVDLREQRAENRQQSVELRRQRGENQQQNAAIQRLREQMQNGG